jgi:hypothetical protein
MPVRQRERAAQRLAKDRQEVAIRAGPAQSLAALGRLSEKITHRNCHVLISEHRFGTLVEVESAWIDTVVAATSHRITNRYTALIAATKPVISTARGHCYRRNIRERDQELHGYCAGEYRYRRSCAANLRCRLREPDALRREAL